MSGTGGLFASLWAYLLFQWDAIINSGLPIFFWNRPRWSVDHIPDQTGKVVIVTGGNSGTGYATCKALYEKGATVYLACRSRQKALKAIDDIKLGAENDVSGIVYPAVPRQNEDGKNVGRLEYLQLDLADLDDVARFVVEFEKLEHRLDALYANAGVMACPEGLHTKQGYTLQFGTNCLGHQHLISLLIPLLSRTSASNPSSLPRIIISSSSGHAAAPSGGVNYRSVVRDPNPSPASNVPDYASAQRPNGSDERRQRGRYEQMKWIEYGQSKWGGIALARWLHWVYGPDEGRRKLLVDEKHRNEFVTISIHPGFVATNLAQHLSLTPHILKWAPWAVHMITRPSAEGALNQLWAGTCPESLARRLSGEYIIPCQKIGHARPDLDRLDKIRGLWLWCEKQTAAQ